MENEGDSSEGGKEFRRITLFCLKKVVRAHEN